MNFGDLRFEHSRSQMIADTWHSQLDNADDSLMIFFKCSLPCVSMSANVGCEDVLLSKAPLFADSGYQGMQKYH